MNCMGKKSKQEENQKDDEQRRERKREVTKKPREGSSAHFRLIITNQSGEAPSIFSRILTFVRGPSVTYGTPNTHAI